MKFYQQVEHQLGDDAPTPSTSDPDSISSDTTDVPELDIKTSTPPTAMKHSLSFDALMTTTSKKPRIAAKSSIRVALETKDEPKGLLKYFLKATEVEHQDHLARMDEEVTLWSEKRRFEEQREDQRKVLRKRRRDAERKRLQRTRLKNLEIMSGLRSPGGRRRKVQKILDGCVPILTTYFFSDRT